MFQLTCPVSINPPLSCFHALLFLGNTKHVAELPPERKMRCGEDADADFLITAGSSSGTPASDALASDNMQVNVAITCGYPQDNF